MTTTNVSNQPAPQSQGQVRRPIAAVAMMLPGLVLTVAVAAQAADMSRVEVHKATSANGGMLMTTVDGSAIPVDNPGARTQVTAMDFLRQHGAVFGVADADAELQADRVRVDDLGYTHSSFQQVYKSVPVFSGVLRVHQDAAGGVTAANGAFREIPDKVSTVALVTEDQAIELAKAALRSATAPQVLLSELVVVDPGWYGDAPLGAHLAYHIELIDEAEGTHEAFFIDAQNGDVLDEWSRVCTLRDRQIYDGHNTGDIPGNLIRGEGAGPVGLVDANRAYDYYGDVYDYYFRAFGRDSIDGAGLRMVATVNSRAPACPNAFWSSFYQQMVFCTGTVTDDIVGHELTHGVTEHSAGLIYQNQSGQLNEAFSDIFGELIDLYNGDASAIGTPGGTPWPDHQTGQGKDTPNGRRSKCSPPSQNYPDGVRWMLGEDANAFGGAIRDMWDPTCFDDPDRAFSPLQKCWPYDSGGVHSGSGVFNHAFAILADGDTFNGITINGIGTIKAGAVFYRGLTTYLTPASDFEDSYYLLKQSAQDLIGTTPNDPRTGTPSASEFTAADAEEVDKALRAVELNTVGQCGVRYLLITGNAPVCDERTTIYADDFESGQNGWTLGDGTINTSNDRWRQIDLLPDGRPGTGWFVPNLGGSDGLSIYGLQSLISPIINLPSTMDFPALKFDHLVQTEAFYDGGNLKIRVNGGGWTRVPASAFTFNGYNVRSLIDDTDGPLGGEPAFSGYGGEWVTSLVDLRSFVSGGDTVQFRFDFGEDASFPVQGWYLDDVEVYDCGVGTDCNGNGIADEAELAIGPHPDLIADHPPAYGALVQLGFDFAYTPLDWIEYGMTFAQRIHLTRKKAIRSIHIWGGYWGGIPGDDEFLVFVRSIGGDGYPSTSGARVGGATRGVWTDTGVVHNGIKIYDVELILESPPTKDPGDYYVEIYRADSGRGDFFWEVSEYGPGEDYFVLADEAPGQFWFFPGYYSLSMQVVSGMRGADCNNNGKPDDCEISEGIVPDLNHNGVPDDCDPDCNTNGSPDDLDILIGISDDCNGDLIPEECEADCDHNGNSDRCDLVDAAFGATAHDHCADAQPICGGGRYSGSTAGQDADGRATCGASSSSPDVWYRYTPAADGHLVVATCSADFDTVLSIHKGCPGTTSNQIDCSDDDCGAGGDGSTAFAEVKAGHTYYVRVSGFNGASGSFDLDVTVAAPCIEALVVDCDNDGLLNTCEAAGGVITDCNTNSVPDDCDINLGIAADCDGNHVPDSCQSDTDGDGLINVCDGCPDDPDKTNAGACGCGVADSDSDNDGVANCVDGCPSDRRKVEPGVCGCGVYESLTDSDADGTPNCIDGCPNDKAKTAPGSCGCGKAETDTDNDGVPDCRDVCSPGDDSIDTDKDGTPDCADACPNDPKKTAPGVCGCGTADVDIDQDGLMSCKDNCPLNGNVDQLDSDNDGVGDVCDGCPADAAKTARGVCGCGFVDVDTDHDGLFDCADNCPNDPTSDYTDTDGDGTGDACDGCPEDASKTEPGVCGCGRPDIDIDGDGVLACNDDCIGTPAGVEVDETGCPIATPPPQPTPSPDADGDGVADSIDLCANTQVGATVDASGCAAGQDIDSNGTGNDDGGDDTPCGTMGMVSMLMLAVGLASMRQRMR